MIFPGKDLSSILIKKDLRDITKFPIEGIGIISFDNDPMKYIVNICIMKEGIYKGFSLQLLLIFSDNYPIQPPKILIFPNQVIDNKFKDCILKDDLIDEEGNHFNELPFDYLSIDLMSPSKVKPRCSISSLLIKIRDFIYGILPIKYSTNKSEIEGIMKSMDLYKRKFKVKDEKGEIEIMHTWKNPYPQIYFKEKENKNIIKSENKENEKLQKIKEYLTCFIFKLDYLDDSNISLGYSIIQKKNGKQKIELYVIPKLLIFEEFMLYFGKNIEIDYYYNINFESSKNEYYYYWIPIYIDNNHYLNNKKAILNSLSIIKCGPLGKQKFEFKPEYLFEIFPIILNKIIEGIFNSKPGKKSYFIRCYFHYALLFKKILQEYEKELIKYINHKLNLIHKNKNHVNKSIIPDIEDFFQCLLFCGRDFHNEKMKKILYSLCEEFLTRQIYWIFYKEKKIDEILQKIDLKNLVDNSDLIEKEIRNEVLKEGHYYIKKNNNNKFLILVQEENIHQKIIDLCFSGGIYDRKYLFESKVKEINEHIEEYLNKKNIAKKRILAPFFKKEIFNDYILLTEEGEEIVSKKLNQELLNKIGDNLKQKIIEYFLYNYKDDNNKTICYDFMKNAFNSQIANKRVLISFFAQKKIEEKGFMETIEKQYGVLLDIEKLNKEIEVKLNEVQSFKKLFEYIGSDFGKNKNDLEIIRESYEIAKLKRYIKNDNIFNLNKEKGRGNIRGRGNGRVRRGMRGRGS